MLFNETIRQGKFLRRYKRFFADVEIDGQTVVAHVPNTGSLKTCLYEDSDCIVTESSNPARKLKATLHFLKTPTSWVGVNTAWPNLLVHEAWEQGLIEDWRALKFARREFKLSKETRLDLVLAPTEAHFEERRDLTYVEIKSVTYAEDGIARFPDAVTTRGQKHLQELMHLKSGGAAGSELVFVVQREDCESFAPADQIDPEYGRLLRQARDIGVKIRALTCQIDPLKGLALHPYKELKLDF